MEQTISAKAAFLQSSYIPLLLGIDPMTLPVFGKMNPQQMVEHMAWSVHLAYGNPEPDSILTPEEQLPKMQAFLQSDKPFRDNTPNALMPDIPSPAKLPGMQAAITDLEQALSEFRETFRAEPGKQVRNSFFGILDYGLSIHLLYKHARHHLRQFGVQPA